MSGMTVATTLKDKKSVLAIDFTINKFQQILANQKYETNSEIFSFNKEGEKLVYSDKNSFLTINPILLQAFNNDSHMQKKIIQYNQYSLLIGILVLLLSIPLRKEYI